MQHRMHFAMVPSFFLPLVVGLVHHQSSRAVAEQEEEGSEGVLPGDDAFFETEGHEIPPAHAVLFPSFCLTIGVMVFYLLSRFLNKLPYTAVMFFIGTVMGIGAELLDDSEDQLNESIRLWIPIDSEVLLLVFLPGLIFKDSLGQNVHLFQKSIVQLLIFAFPLVLAGTVLTALIAYYIFPYGWSFNLAMTFGSILSATDPVAVAALLEEVGAPPRLKVHIAGESLLNDGAAIVFFSIFVARYLFELGIEGVGEDVDWGRGVAMFCQKAIGGVCIGIFFGLGLLTILFLLKRRFNREENVVEVTATIAIAYIGYYVADAVWATSGVIATVTLGLMIKFLGRAMFNDAKLLEDFWTLVEHLLNTILFTLGGTVWGAVIANGGKEKLFTGRDWGYLVLLYIFLTVIRAFLFASVYPLTSRIGLKGSPQETIFSIYGGLRGAVGLALALFLDNEVQKHTNGFDNVFRIQTRKVFGFVGGIAFMTLCINGSTAGPLLIWLGLSDSTDTRNKIVEAYQVRFKTTSIQALVKLMTQRRFRQVDFALVKHHVPHIADMTKSQLMEAVERYKESTPAEDYNPPYLKRILPYLKADDDEQHFTRMSTLSTTQEEPAASLDPEAHARKIKHELRTKNRMKRRTKSTMRHMMGEEPLSSTELRTLFISILRSAYEKQISNGELEDQQFLAIALESSLDLAADAVAKGEHLHDWDYVNWVDGPLTGIANRFKNSLMANSVLDLLFRGQSHATLKNTAMRLKIERSLAFMSAHRYAQRFFHREFENAESELSEAGKLVVRESQTEYEKAEAVLTQYDPKEVSLVVSHKFCMILLNGGVSYLAKLVRNGLLKDEEAEHQVKHIEENLRAVLSCSMKDHPGELSFEEDDADDCCHSHYTNEKRA